MAVLRGRRYRRAPVAALLVAVVALTGCGGSNASPPTVTASPPPAPLPSPTPRPRPKPGCYDGDPMLAVHNPGRLIVRADCVTVSGIVGCIKTSEDGDVHMLVQLDTKYQKYLTKGNDAWRCQKDRGSDTAPRLVVEVVPQHCTVPHDNCLDEIGVKRTIIPKSGQHITATGPWVLDTAHYHGATRWAEIHPALRIVVDN